MKKIPLRMCIVTREKHPKKELIRVVKYNDKVFIDESGKQNGKGCYLKKDIEIIKRAKANKIIDKILEINVEEEIYDNLIKLIK